MASPWVLVGAVWEGPFEAALAALGDDADLWRDPPPQSVRLAIYQHQSSAHLRLTLREFTFATAAEASAVLAAQRPAAAEPYDVGDGGFWTELGVTFALANRVTEIFGNQQAWHGQISAAYLAGIVLKQAGRP